MSHTWGSTPRLTDWPTVSRNVTLTLTLTFATKNLWRRRRGNPVPKCITGPPSSWGIWIWRPGPPGWGSLESETVKFGHESRRTWTQEWLRWREPAAILNGRPVLPSRERPTSTNTQLCDSNKHLFVSPRWVLETKIDWPTDRRS
jgi:hypothetical protein